MQELSIEILSSDSPAAPDPDTVPERIVLAANSMRNTASARSRAAAQITCTVGGRLLWATCVHRPVTLLAGGPGWVAAALQDASLLLLSASGRRLLPPVVMQAPIALLSSAPGSRLVALLSNGTTKVWNVLQRKVRPPVRIPAGRHPAFALSLPLQAHSRPGILTPMLHLGRGSIGWLGWRPPHPRLLHVELRDQLQPWCWWLPR